MVKQDDRYNATVGSDREFDSWSWRQIMAAITGGAAMTEARREAVNDVSKPHTLVEAAQAFHEVALLLTAVQGTIRQNTKILAGDGGLWRGALADSFRGAMEMMDKKLQTHVDQIRDNPSRTRPVPEGLLDAAVKLDTAIAKVKAIDNHYAGAARSAGASVHDGLVHVSEKPEVVDMMTRDMKRVIKELAAGYELRHSVLKPAPVTNFNPMGGGPGGGAGLPVGVDGLPTGGPGLSGMGGGGSGSGLPPGVTAFRPEGSAFDSWTVPDTTPSAGSSAGITPWDGKSGMPAVGSAADLGLPSNTDANTRLQGLPAGGLTVGGAPMGQPSLPTGPGVTPWPGTGVNPSGVGGLNPVGVTPFVPGAGLTGAGGGGKIGGFSGTGAGGGGKIGGFSGTGGGGGGTGVGKFGGLGAATGTQGAGGAGQFPSRQGVGAAPGMPGPGSVGPGRGQGGYPMPMGGMGGGMPGAGGAPGGQERQRSTWLVEDDDVWSSDRRTAPGVVGGRTEE
ncbi:hypothetical protein [Micromonospora sp. NBC_01412]|uniref:hypothetical protein n=1 Tax=Micromonospora sp. NBC_01412 TaxID=2903590 RepID=UPI003255C80F